MVHIGLPASKLPFTYSSSPRSPWVCKNERKELPLPYGSIVFDRRVIKGPAYVQHPTATAGVESQAARNAEARRRAMAVRKARKDTIFRLRTSTPPSTKRTQGPTKTETDLKEVVDHPVDMAAETQTELMLDRPQSPLYIPAQSGIDTSTQIQLDEIFDFDLEVEPILEVLVGRTLEQALVEVKEDEELEAVRIQQRYFKEARQAELAEEQRLQAQDTKRRFEIEHRLNQHEYAIKNQEQARDRIAAAVISTGYLESLIPEVVQNLKDSGQVLDPIQKNIDGAFMGWLMREVKLEIQRVLQADECILNILLDIQRLREDEAKDEGEDIEDWEMDKYFHMDQNKEFSFISEEVLNEEEEEEEEEEEPKKEVSDGDEISWHTALHL